MSILGTQISTKVTLWREIIENIEYFLSEDMANISSMLKSPDLETERMNQVICVTMTTQTSG